MRKIALALLAFFAFALTAHAQTSAVTATITDSDNQTWNNGSYTISFVQSSGNSAPPIWNGTPLDSAHKLFKGFMSPSGVLTVSIPDNNFVTPSGSSWLFVLCPYSSGPCSQVQTPVIGSSVDLSSTLSGGITAPRFPALQGAYGYLDVEVTPIPPPGGFYFNVTNNLQRVWNGSSWQNGGGGGGGGSVGPGTTNFLSCFTTTTSVGNCADAITDVAGLFTVPATTQIGGGSSAGSIAMPSGPTSGCQTPATGFNILCSDGTLNTLDVSLNGAAYTPLTASSSVSSGVVGQPAAYNSTSTVDNVPLYIAVDAVQGAGIGQAGVPWVTGTTYSLCQEVSFSAANYLAVSTANGSTTPGGNPHIWYAIPNGSRPTQYDCAFYIAQSQVTSAQGIDLQLGMETYSSCIGMTYPTVSSPGLPGVNIIGGGVGTSIIKQTCTLISGGGGDGLAMLNVPPATTNFNLPRLQFSGFTLDANNLAPAIFDLHACQQCNIEHLQFLNGPDGIDHYFEAGTVGGGSRGWVYELKMEDVTTGYNPGTIGIGHGNGAFAASVTVSGGVPTITVSNGGANYGGQTTFRLVKTGGVEACTSVGTFTPTFSGSTITAVATTSTGCAATGSTFLQIYPQTSTNYSFTFSNMSDSHFISDLVPGGVGAKCGVNVSNVTSFNAFYKFHPIGTFNGVCNQGTNNFYNMQLDTIYNWGIDEEGQGDVANYTGSMFEWAASNLSGSSDYHFGKVTGAPTNAPASVNIFSDACGNSPAQSGYAHLVAALGAIDSTSNGLPSFLTIYNTQYCNVKNTNTIQYTNSAPQIVWGNGTNANYWLWNYSAGFSAALTLQNVGGTNTNPWTWFLTNSNAATSGANQKSPLFGGEGNYWDSSISQTYGWSLQTTFASGAGPLATFAFKKNGTEPSGGHLWLFDSFVQPATTTVGALPAAAAGNVGWIIVVSDSTTVAAEGQTCVGSSTNKALAFSNGSVWKCF